MDAFIKVPRPDDKRDALGLKALDEPAASQSDPTVLDLQLRAVSMRQHGACLRADLEHLSENPNKFVANRVSPRTNRTGR